MSYEDIFPQAPQAKKVGYEDIFSPPAPARKVMPKPEPIGAEDPGFWNTMLIAAGRTGDKLASGMSQLGQGAIVAAKEATGFGDPKSNLHALSRIAAEQQSRDQAYAPLQEMRPFATGIGETLPALATPVSRAVSVGQRIGTTGAGMAAMGGAQYGSAEDRAIRAAKDGIMGMLGQGGAEVVGRLISPVKSSLTAAQQGNVANAANNVGYRPLPSQMTGSQALAGFEDMLARSPGSSGVMADFAGRNAESVANRAGQAIGADMRPGEMLTKDVLAKAQKDIGDAYGALTPRMNLPVTSDVIDAVNAAQSTLGRGATAGKSEALGTLTELKDLLFKSKNLDGETVKSWVSDLKALARGTDNNTVATQLKNVATKLEESAQGGDRAAWQALNKKNASFETLMRPNVLNEVTGQVNPLATARALESQFGKSLKTGKVSGPLVDIAELGRSLPPLRQGSQTYERGQAGSLGGWLMGPPRYLAAKAITSQGFNNYLAKGLLGNPEASAQLALLSRYGLLPASIGGMDAGAGLLGLSTNLQR